METTSNLIASSEATAQVLGQLLSDTQDKVTVTVKLLFSVVYLFLCVAAFGISLFSKHVATPVTLYLYRNIKYTLWAYFHDMSYNTTNLEYRMQAL